MKIGYVSLTALLMVGCQVVPSQQQFSTQTLRESQPVVEAESRLNQIDFRQLKQQKNVQLSPWFWAVVAHVVMHILG